MRPKTTRLLKKRTFAKKKVASVSVKSIKKLIKKEIAVEAETKWSTQAISSDSAIKGGGILSTTNGYVSSDLIPAIGQGLGAGDRIGNKIKPRHLEVRGFIYASPYDVTTNPTAVPFTIDMYIVRSKVTNSSTIPSLSGLMRYGDATEAYDGSMLNALDNLDTTTWTLVKHKRFKMNTRAATTVDGQNNGGQLCKTFKIKLKLPPFVYQDNTFTQPQNYSMWALFGYTNNDNTIDANTITRARLNLQTLIAYDDE